MRLPVLLAVTALLAAASGAIATAQDMAQIEVTGQGRVAAVPDMASLQLGVTASAETPGDAVRAMSQAMSPVLAALAEAGIDPRDIQTSQLSLRPRYMRDRIEPDGPPRIDGYDADNQVTVRIRDIALVGELLDKVVATGANRFEGLSFGLQDPAPAEDAARTAAMQDAIRKAQTLADAAGVTLGPVQRIIEIGGGMQPGPKMMREAMMDAAVPVAEGEVETSVSVSASFAILP